MKFKWRFPRQYAGADRLCKETGYGMWAPKMSHNHCHMRNVTWSVTGVS